MLEYPPTVMAGPGRLASNVTIRRAIEIQDGRVLNPRILTFQNRAEEYPYAR